MGKGEVWAQEEELNLPEIQPPAASSGGGNILRFIGAYLMGILLRDEKANRAKSSPFLFSIYEIGRFFEYQA